MSNTVTSGFVALAFSTASRPSLASAVTSHPGCASSSERSPFAYNFVIVPQLIIVRVPCLPPQFFQTRIRESFHRCEAFLRPKVSFADALEIKK